MVIRRTAVTTTVLVLALGAAGCSDATGPDDDVVLEEAAPGPDNLSDGNWEVRGSGLQQGLFEWVFDPTIEISQTRDQVEPGRDIELLRWLPHTGIVPDGFRLVFQVKTTGSGPGTVEVLNDVPTGLDPDDVRASMSGLTGYAGWTEFEISGTIPDDSPGLMVRLQMNGGLQRSTVAFRSLWLELS